MTFDELRRVITGTSASDWSVVEYGTTYCARFGMVSQGGRSWMETDEHTHVAVYKPDISITLAWGMDNGDGGLNLGWNDRFPDPTVTRFYIDVFYNGMLVDRWFAYLVDGARAVLPVDEVAIAGDIVAGDAEPIGHKAYESDARVARLIHGLSGCVESFDDYLERTGITVLPDRK